MDDAVPDYERAALMLSLDATLHDWLALAIATATAIYTFMTRRDDKVDKALVHLQGDIKHVDERLIVVEAWMANAPSKEDLHRLELGMAQVAGKLNVLVERVSPLAATVDRLQLFLLENERPRPVWRKAKAETETEEET
ncbi:MAG: DUF2730 family protein [Hyphomicrobiales bacterium]|nr:DUF2730 family protein [Hyphomicrobiales bacterium]MDE2113842.1 DUF2730 family protein [Hyphomicrobiales bacterium]